MTRAIPEQIVAAVAELAESLATWGEEGRDGRLEQHEAAVLERVRQVLPQLLEAGVAVATCSDLLKPGGYGRLPAYMESLAAAMKAGGPTNVNEFILKTA